MQQIKALEALKPGSNCTFMELKWVQRFEALVGDYCSNCTFMELKSGTSGMKAERLRVLIVPLWN